MPYLPFKKYKILVFLPIHTSILIKTKNSWELLFL